MPPVPAKLTEDAKEVIASLDRRARFVKNDTIPRLLACGTPSTPTNNGSETPAKEQQRISEEVRDELGVLARDIENLSMMIDDQSGEKARMALQDIVDEWNERIQELRAQTRTAILTSKRLVDAQKYASNRAELFAGAPSINEKAGGDPSSQTLETASSQLTASLANLVSSLQNELQTSVLSTQLLTTSTNTLAAASQQHDTLTSAMDAAKGLLGALEKADWMDRLLVLGAFTFFLACVAWVGWSRTVGRGITWVIWIYSWIPGGGGSGSASAKEKAAQKSLEVSASLASSVSASVASVASLSIASMASVVTSIGIKEGLVSPDHVSPSDEPDPTPTPTAIPDLEDDEVVTISTLLSSIIPPDPEPTPLAGHDEL